MSRSSKPDQQSLAEAIETLEMQCDTLFLRLARIETANDERHPGAIVERLAAGENPIAVWRAYRGLDLAGLAVKSGVAPMLLASLEAGSAEPSLRTAAALAKALDIGAEDLMPWPQDEVAA